MTETFTIEYNSAGVRSVDGLKESILAAVGSSPLASELEWFSFDNGRWQGVTRKCSQAGLEASSDKSFVVFSDDCTENLTGVVGSDWHRLVVELLIIMSSASRNGKPVFRSNGWALVTDSDISLPKAIIIEAQ